MISYDSNFTHSHIHSESHMNINTALVTKEDIHTGPTCMHMHKNEISYVSNASQIYGERFMLGEEIFGWGDKLNL